MKLTLSELCLAAGLALLLAAPGCGGGSDGTSGTAASAAPAAPATAVAPAAPAAAEDAELSALDQIPTTDELEQKMTETVTDANADAEFEKLQKELEEEAGG